MNDEKTLNGITIAALVIGLAMVVAHVVVPKANPTQNRRDREKEELEMRILTRQSREKVTQLKDANAARVFEATGSQLGPMLMSRVTAAAEKSQIKVIAFRPQRVEEIAGLTKTPYVVSLEGSYGRIVQFARDLETSEQQLSVTSIQCASSDGATDLVSASVGLVAFRTDPPAKKPLAAESKETEKDAKPLNKSPERASPRSAPSSAPKKPNG